MTQFFDMFLHDAHFFVLTVTIAPLFAAIMTILYLLLGFLWGSAKK